MNQSERRNYLIQKLLEEQPQYAKMQIPGRCEEQKTLLRALMNVRMPGELSEEFLQIQDAYLAEENAGRGIVTLAEIQELSTDLYLWKGDITRLQVGAIVNAANSGMTGCYQPCHNCIDNCIHTYAGIELRNYCNDIMQRQGYAEPTGQAKITPAFNLPCDYVIHTVGPIVQGRLRNRNVCFVPVMKPACVLQRKITWKASHSAVFPQGCLCFPMKGQRNWPYRP